MKKTLPLSLLLLVGCNHPLQHQADAPVQHYQIVGDGNGNSWRLDTQTGEIVKCWQGNPGISSPQCYTAIIKSSDGAIQHPQDIQDLLNKYGK